MLSFLVIANMNFYRVIQIFLLLIFLACCLAFDMIATQGNIVVMSTLTCLMGLSLSLLICQELFKLDRVRDNGNIPLSLTFFGIYGSVLCALGDKTHYMNRDDPQWSYINILLAGGFVLIAFVVTLSWLFNGCRCCACCCKCCNECCGIYDEDDEKEKA